MYLATWIKLIVIAACLIETGNAEPLQEECAIDRVDIENFDDDHLQVTVVIEPMPVGDSVAAEGKMIIQVTDKNWFRDPIFGQYYVRGKLGYTWTEPPTHWHNETFVVKKTDYVTDEWGRDPKWVSPPIKCNASEHLVVFFENPSGNISSTAGWFPVNTTAYNTECEPQVLCNPPPGGGRPARR